MSRIINQNLIELGSVVLKRFCVWNIFPLIFIKQKLTTGVPGPVTLQCIRSLRIGCQTDTLRTTDLVGHEMNDKCDILLF